MKKHLLLLVAVLFVWLTACGSSAPDSAEGSAPAAGAAEDFNMSDGSASAEASADLLDVLYFKKLNESSIMAACYTSEGTERMGGDYFIVHVGDAEIFNMDGETITLDQIVRGSTLQIQWPGMVMESYPAQISAETVQVTSDEIAEGFPEEDEIPSTFGGPKWWEEEPVLEVPDMNITYQTELAVVGMRIAPHSGTWHYAEQDYDGEAAISEDNALLDGQHPLDWTYDDNNTIQHAKEIFSVTTDEPVTDPEDLAYGVISLGPYPNTKTFTVTAYVVGGDSREGIPVPISEGEYITLLDEDAVYVVETSWDEARYQGAAVYGFLVTKD